MLSYTESKTNHTPPLVLIHGAGGTRFHWQPQLRHSPKLRVLTPDLPAHGESVGEACTSLDEYANEVVNWLAGLGVEKFVIGGISMGGGIAQLIALNHPERVTGLVLVATGAKLRVSPQILEGVRSDFAKTVDLIIEAEFSAEVPLAVKKLAHKALLQVNPETLYKDFAACNSFDALARVTQIKAPTLVLVGSADKMTPEKFSRSLAEQVSGAELQVYSGAGHMLTLERMVEVADRIEHWLIAKSLAVVEPLL